MGRGWWPSSRPAPLGGPARHRGGFTSNDPACDDAVEELREQGDHYWANLAQPLGDAVEAWVLYERGETERALELMDEAADLEESMQKHPITPGEVLPVRELHGDLCSGKAARRRRWRRMSGRWSGRPTGARRRRASRS